MTKHSATPVHYPPTQHNAQPCVLRANNVSDSHLGNIISRCVITEQQDPPTDVHHHSVTTLSSDFLRAMGQIRLHLEAKVVQAGHLGPLDFAYNDFADLFNDVPVGEARLAVFRALAVWYKTIYVRHQYWENNLREMYEDDAPLTRQQELSFFENMRSGVAYNSARWRELFLHRNWGLVGKVAKFYTGTLHALVDWDRRNQDLPTERQLVLSAGYEGLKKAVDNFKPELGWKFSTHAWWWIKGEITGYFKKSKAELQRPEWLMPTEVLQGPRVAEDYLELNSAVEKALARLCDPRKSDIIALRFGLFGKEEQTLTTIGKHFGVSPQRVRAIERATLARLKKDHELRLFYMGWFKW